MVASYTQQDCNISSTDSSKRAQGTRQSTRPMDSVDCEHVAKACGIHLYIHTVDYAGIDQIKPMHPNRHFPVLTVSLGQKRHVLWGVQTRKHTQPGVSV